MQTRGAVIRSAPGIYEVADFELDDPQPGEQPMDNPSTWDAPTRAARASPVDRSAARLRRTPRPPAPVAVRAAAGRTPARRYPRSQQSSRVGS